MKIKKENIKNILDKGLIYAEIPISNKLINNPDITPEILKREVSDSLKDCFGTILEDKMIIDKNDLILREKNQTAYRGTISILSHSEFCDIRDYIALLESKVPDEN